MSPIWVTSDQQTLDWLKERIGCLTASRMADAIAYLKNGKEGEARKKLKIDIVAERMTDTMVSRYVTDAMHWGIENEQLAKDRYEEITGRLITPCGFALHDSIPYFGASPDGLIGDDGLIEVKCPTSATFVSWCMGNIVPEMHEPQMLAQLAVTGRKWVDFFAFDPRVKFYDHQYFLRRFEPPKKDIEIIEQAAKSLLSEVEQLFEQVTTSVTEGAA